MFHKKIITIPIYTYISERILEYLEVSISVVNGVLYFGEPCQFRQQTLFFQSSFLEEEEERVPCAISSSQESVLLSTRKVFVCVSFSRTMASEINVSVELARPRQHQQDLNQQQHVSSFSSSKKDTKQEEHHQADQPSNFSSTSQDSSFKNKVAGQMENKRSSQQSKRENYEDEEKQKDFQPRSYKKNAFDDNQRNAGDQQSYKFVSSSSSQQQEQSFDKEEDEADDQEDYGRFQQYGQRQDNDLDEAQLNRYQQVVQTKRALTSFEQPDVSSTTTRRTYSSSIQHRLGGSLKITPEKIGVVIAGWPNELSIQCAKACVKRGYRMLPIGICMNDSEDDRVDITDVGTIVLYRYADSQLRGKLIEQLSMAENKLDLFPVVIDTSVDVDNIRLYQALKIPFVFETPADNLEIHQRAVRETREMRCSAVIAQRMDKHVAAVDDLLNEMATRFPGLFAENFQQKQQQQTHRRDDRSGGGREGFDFSIKTSEGNEKVNRQMLDSMSDLFNRDVTLRDVQHIPSSEQQERHHGMTNANRKEQQQHVRRSYELRASNRVGSNVFTFEQNVNATYECAEGVADSVSFLVQHVLECPRPKVYGIEDVAQQGRFLTW